VTLVWHGSLAAGLQRIQVRLDAQGGNFGVPYTDSGFRGSDVLIVSQP
jgi:hypothetical protein